MKKLLVTFLVGIISYVGIAQNVGIGTTTPNASAQLDVSSTNSGFLPPRMTYAQRNAIVNPAAGLILYCTDCVNGGEMQFFNGSQWLTMSIHAEGDLAVVETANQSSISYRSARLNGNLVSKGGKLLLAKGFCYSTTPNPTEENAMIVSGNNLGNYSLTLDSLNPNTTYYVRAFATTTAGTAYGTEINFTTQSLTVPVITTNSAGNVSNTIIYASAIITNNGGAPVSNRGFVWSTSSNPTLSNFSVSLGAGSDSFNTNISGLNMATTYYLRAYAVNAQGTSYGNQVSFTTNTISLATVNTSVPAGISYTSATVGGEISSDGGNVVTQRGICYNTTSNPTIESGVITAGSGTGSFSLSLNNLQTNTTYYIRAFATNAGGTAYGVERLIQTIAVSVPVISSISVYSVSANTAASGGVIVTDGGSSITQKGICWSINPLPTIVNNRTLDGTGSNSFNSALTGLLPSTQYYVRAYASNALGTSYGNQEIFTTLNNNVSINTAPIIGTVPMTTDTNYYTCGGYISDVGSDPITQQGICWSLTNINPTLQDSVIIFTPNSQGFFYINFNIRNSCNSIVYYRAFAANVNGLTYANVRNSRTGLNPYPKISIEQITSNSVRVAGQILNDGGCQIQERGFCWDIAPNPTITDFSLQVGSGVGNFLGNINTIGSNTTYYIRAYVKTIRGVFYGQETNFTTLPGSSLAIGQVHQGGIIFYLDSTGNHGLVATETQIGTYQWGCYGTSIGSTFETLGSGAQNTAVVVSGCNEINIAAKACNDLIRNGFNDWYMPSFEELKLVYNRLKTANLGNYANGAFWSSSERYSGGNCPGGWARNIDFSSGYDGNNDGYCKNRSYYTLAIRSF